MTEFDNINKSVLKVKEICRFCMIQDASKLSGIFDKQYNKFKPCAPIPIQIMACVSIEVFSNDEMPSMVCDNCRMIMDYCYRFKQMCKKSDTELRQFPLTGIWPTPLDLPKMHDDLFKTEVKIEVKTQSPCPPPVPKILNPGARSSGQNQSQSQPKSSESKIKNLSNKIALTSGATTSLSKPKILNKSSMKILNRNVPNLHIEPIFSKPKTIIKDDGCMEVVTEVIESQSPISDLTDPEKITLISTEPSDINVFCCPYCERSFPLQQLLDIHLINHNRERSFECETCNKRFFSKYDLGKHLLIHTGEKPFECVVCQKSFSRSTLLYRHEKIHIDTPKYLCQYCDRPFLSKEELSKHIPRHEKSRPFNCKICDKSFAFKQGLERHESVHSKNQPFPCQYCELSFPTPSKLARHLTSHAGARPYPCKLCPKSYLLSHHLTRHLRSHKEGSGNFKCFDCDTIFSSRDDLVYHSALHATQTLVCPLCKEQFEDLDDCTDHIKMHAEGEQYACEFCDLIFMTADKLQDHSSLEHVEELAEYEADTRNNMNNITLNSNSNTNKLESIVQEFVIEEYRATPLEDDTLIEKNPLEIKIEPNSENDYYNEEDEAVISKEIGNIITNEPKDSTIGLKISEIRGSDEIDDDRAKSESEKKVFKRKRDNSEEKGTKTIGSKNLIYKSRNCQLEENGTKNKKEHSPPKKSARIKEQLMQKSNSSTVTVPSFTAGSKKVEMTIGNKKIQLKKLVKVTTKSKKS